MHGQKLATAAALMLTALCGCAPTLNSKPGTPVSSAAYNSAVMQQGTGYYCDSEKCDVPPLLEHAVAPLYPSEAHRAGRGGEVLIFFCVRKDGSTDDFQFASDSAPEFIQAAIDSVVQWKYKPAILNGEPVEFCRIGQTIVFSVNK